MPYIEGIGYIPEPGETDNPAAWTYGSDPGIVYAQPTPGTGGVITPSGNVIDWNLAPYGGDIVQTPQGAALLPRADDSQVTRSTGITGVGIGAGAGSFGFPTLPISNLPFGNASQQIDPLMLILLMGQSGGSDNTLLLFLLLQKQGFNLAADANTGSLDLVKTVHPAPWDSPTWQNFGSNPLNTFNQFAGFGATLGALRDWIGGVKQTIPISQLYY